MILYRALRCQEALNALRRPFGGKYPVRLFSFSFAGPKSLDDILKKDMVVNKTKAEVADLWFTYHESRENVHGLVLKGKDKSILDRAATSPFFVQPIFRDDGFFMLISQFMEPTHFCLAYLEDYKLDAARAQPLLTLSVFDDYSEDKDLTLVRVDVLNKGISDDEGYKVARSICDAYLIDDEYMAVHAFNKKPSSFDFDEHIAKQNEKWRESKGDAGDGDGEQP